MNRKVREMSWPDRFTMAALLACVVCILVIFFLPVLQQERNGGYNPFKRNAKSVVLAVQNFSDVYDQLPPHMADGTPNPDVIEPVTEPIGFLTSVLPWLERQRLYERIDKTIPWNDAANRAAYATKVKDFVSPDGELSKTPEGYAITHLVPSSRILAMEGPTRIDDITDGASTTIVFGGIDESAVPAWGDPDASRDPARGFAGGPHAFGGLSGAATLVVFVDGNMRYMSPETDPRIAKALATPNGGEKLSDADLQP